MQNTAAPSIEPIRNCLYGRHIESARPHAFCPVSQELTGAPASSRVQKSALVCVESVHVVVVSVQKFMRTCFLMNVIKDFKLHFEIPKIIIVMRPTDY